jgi:hypothetical protein
MGAALIVPLVALVMLAVLWFTFFAKKTRDQAKADQELPDEPYARREEELRRLRDEHAQSDPAMTQHPARRP